MLYKYSLYNNNRAISMLGSVIVWNVGKIKTVSQAEGVFIGNMGNTNF